jgi:hypothetical protein
MKKTLLACLALLSLAARSAAQEPRPTPDPRATPTPTAVPTPEPPKAPPELTKLQFLVGDWAHDEVHHGAANGVPARGVARSRIAWILGGHRLYLTYKSLGPVGEYEGRGLFGWDPAEKVYRLDWFDNHGAVQRYAGSFDPDEALVFSGESTGEGGRVRQQLTIRKQPGNKFLLTDESAVGDQPVKLTLESLAQAAPVATPAAPGATPAGDAAKAPGTTGETGKAAPGPATGKGTAPASPTATPTPR